MRPHPSLPWFLLAFAPPLLAGTAPEAVLQPPMQGQILDPQGRGLEGVEIRVEGQAPPPARPSDAKGRFALPSLPLGRYRVRFQKEGYVGVDRIIVIGPDLNRKGMKVLLLPEATATVEVVAGSMAQVKTTLCDDIIKTEALSSVQIQRLSAGSLNEAVDFNPGISVQTECSICNVRNVVLNNLPGRFTTILFEGVPIFSSVSGAYGLDMIGVNGVSQIEISRGAGTSLIAPEALAGTVNLVGRRPEKNELILEPQTGTFGSRRMDAWVGRTFQGGAYTANLHLNQHEGIDGNGNRVTEYSGYRRRLLDLGVFLDDARGFSIRARLDGVDERRGGGARGFDHQAIRKSISGNPFDWRGGRGGSPDARGWIRPDRDFEAALAEGQNPLHLSDGRVLIPYDAGRGGMSELIHTQRLQSILVAERSLTCETRLKVALGAARHSQDSFYEGDDYDATQNQFYLETSLQSQVGDTLVSFGLNQRYEDLRSMGRLGGARIVSGLDNYLYRTPGTFLQGYRTFFEGRLEVNASVRHDEHNVFGGITTPRLNLLWRHTRETTSRVALGKGFRAPTSFFEQDHGILSTTRIIREIHSPETSRNASYTFSHAGEHTALVLSASYNRIDHFALLDSGAKDPGTGEPVTRFTQAPDPVVVRGLDGTLTWKLGHGFETTLGAEHFSYHFAPGTLSFARPEDRAYLRLDGECEGWDAFIRATWTGTMDLARFYDYANTPRYNLDGSPKLRRSPTYWTVDLGGRWALRSTLTLMAGLNNAFNHRQTDQEDFLWVNPQGHLDVTQVWGPGRGRSGYVGLKWNL